MLRTISLLFLSVLISYATRSQSLEGAWEGTYSDDEYDYLNIRNEFYIQLYFQLNSDGTNSIYSTSYINGRNEKENKIICLLNYQLIGTDSIYLEEVKVIQLGNAESVCFQRMQLKIDQKKNHMHLTGTWDSPGGICSKGTIRFKKKIKK